MMVSQSTMSLRKESLGNRFKGRKDANQFLWQNFNNLFRRISAEFGGI